MQPAEAVQAHRAQAKSSGKTLRLVNGKIEVDSQLKELAKKYKEETGVDVQIES